MSGLPLDDPLDDPPGLDSGVLPHLDVREAGQPRLRTGDLEYREIRDASWLANALHPTAPEPPPGTRPESPAAPAAERPPPPPPGEPEPSEPREPAELPQRRGAPQEWTVGRPHPVRAAVFDRDASDETAPLVWPSTPALPNRRLIAKALRPLSRRNPSPWQEELDEEITAERSVQDRLWLPVFRPASWHEFELVIVVDTAGAAVVWQQMVHELCDLLRTQGAFRNVRVLLVDGGATDTDQVMLRAPGADGAVSGWRDLLDPTGRTLFLVLTDGIGEGWRTGAVTRVVSAWVRHTPVALVNLLPQRLWHWSRLTPRRVRLRAASPGAPNVRLHVRTEPGMSTMDDSVVPIPELGLEPEWRSAWAKLIAVPGAGWVDTTSVFVASEAVVVPAEELLSSSRRGDTVRVARLIGDSLGPRNPVVRNFRDALADPEITPEPEATAETRPHLRVQEAVFRVLSGKYAPRASRLRGIYCAEVTSPSPGMCQLRSPGRSPRLNRVRTRIRMRDYGPNPYLYSLKEAR